MFEVTQRGETTTVKTQNFIFKITFSRRYRRYQVKHNNRMNYEGNFNACLAYCSRFEESHSK